VAARNAQRASPYDVLIPCDQRLERFLAGWEPQFCLTIPMAQFSGSAVYTSEKRT
jgi:hypothetical protein